MYFVIFNVLNLNFLLVDIFRVPRLSIEKGTFMKSLSMGKYLFCRRSLQ